MTSINFDGKIFAADTETRTLRGLIVPFGAVGNTSAGAVEFHPEAFGQIKAEELVLVSYLPTQLSEADVRAELAQLKTLGVVDLKSVMAHFKTRFAGRYDGGLVSRLAKESSC